MAKKKQSEEIEYEVSSTKFDIWYTKDATMSVRGKKEIQEFGRQGFSKRMATREDIEIEYGRTRSDDRIKHALYPNICYFRKKG